MLQGSVIRPTQLEARAAHSLRSRDDWNQIGREALPPEFVRSSQIFCGDLAGLQKANGPRRRAAVACVHGGDHHIVRMGRAPLSTDNKPAEALPAGSPRHTASRRNVGNGRRFAHMMFSAIGSSLTVSTLGSVSELSKRGALGAEQSALAGRSDAY